MSKGAGSRAAAALVIADVLEHGRSVNQALPLHSKDLEPRDRAHVQALAFGVLRNLPLLNAAVSEFLDKPLKKDLVILHHLLLVGAYQLLLVSTSDHAAVAATVEATVTLRKRRQKGLVNAVLRNLQRQRAQLLPKLQQRQDLEHAHPRWLADSIAAAYPQRATEIFAANNQQAPMWLRVNLQQTTVEAFLGALRAFDPELVDATSMVSLPSAIKLNHAVDVRQLPGFELGWFSVQDIAAQHAAPLLAAQPNERVLDCCAAPGGKTAHLLELAPQAQVTALDIEAQRLERVYENLTRLQLSAKVICGDAAAPEQWWDGELFDKVLLDAPCSATGVIRRHPDIKWLRRASDINALVQLQAKILDALWSLIRPGGRLVYATCSILPQENQQQMEAFVARHADALPQPTDPSGAFGWQRLPGEQDGDGFYYAIVDKAQ